MKSLLFPSSTPFLPLDQSTWECSERLMNQAGGIQMQVTLTTEPSIRQELCLGTVRYWSLLNPHAGFVTIPCQAWGLCDVPKDTQLVSSKAKLWRSGFLPLMFNL